GLREGSSMVPACPRPPTRACRAMALPATRPGGERRARGRRPGEPPCPSEGQNLPLRARSCPIPHGILSSGVVPEQSCPGGGDSRPRKIRVVGTRASRCSSMREYATAATELAGLGVADVPLLLPGVGLERQLPRPRVRDDDLRAVSLGDLAPG